MKDNGSRHLVLIDYYYCGFLLVGQDITEMIMEVIMIVNLAGNQAFMDY